MRPRRSLSSVNQNAPNHNHYHHHSHHKTTPLTKSITCCNCCSGSKRTSRGSSEIGSSVTCSDTGSTVSNSNTATQHEQIFWYPSLIKLCRMDDILNIIRNSQEQYDQAVDLINILKSNKIFTSQTVTSSAHFSTENDFYMSDQMIERLSYNQTTKNIYSNSCFLNPDVYLNKYVKNKIEKF